MKNLSRTQLLALGVVLLVAVNLVWHLVANWGLVTIHAHKEPLSRVAASIERQAGIRLVTTLDPATEVTMDVDHVPFTEALETLALVTDARWRLAYFLAPSKGDLRAGIEAWRAGAKDESWRWIERRLPPLVETDPEAAPADPRRNLVLVKPEGAATPELQSLLEQAAALGDASATLPKEWNPVLTASLPATAAVGDVVARLARAAHGASAEVFVLTQGRRMGRGERPAGPPEEGGGFRWDNPEQAQLRVDLLPAAQRPAAQKRIDEMKAMAALSPEDRRKRWEAMRNSPGMQDQMQERMENREAKMTPDQRAQRYANYLSNRAAATGH